MPGLVQRVPAGLLQVLNSVSQGENPRLLADDVQGVLELLQFYGLSQRQILQNQNAALTAGTPLGVNLPNSWCVFYGADIRIAKTATLTALRGSISLLRTSGSSLVLASADLGPYGATQVGNASVPFWAPYPMLIPPGGVILSRADIIGTDASVNATLTVEVGVLG